ncbi:MAG: response regulator [Bacteriovoracaceae bacterium]|jgi:DNA-binding response OmpR family regulator|nr:response regulator [Bacteriovoracaceae bacterium]
MSKGKKVLIVDDDEASLFILTKMLNENGYEVEVANDGLTALQYIDREPPCLVLLDLGLPKIKGEEVLKRIRKKRDRVLLPIVVITLKKDEDNVVECLEMGANDYLTKPVNVNIALARIEMHLEMSTLKQS